MLHELKTKSGILSERKSISNMYIMNTNTSIHYFHLGARSIEAPTPPVIARAVISVAMILSGGACLEDHKSILFDELGRFEDGRRDFEPREGPSDGRMLDFGSLSMFVADDLHCDFV